MNGIELAHAWEQICSRIKTYNGVSASQVDAIFSRLELQAMSTGCAFITADTDFIRNWVEKYYLDLLKAAFRDIYHTEFTIFLELNNTPSPATPEIVIPDIPLSALTEQTNNQTITYTRTVCETPKTPEYEREAEELLENYEKKVYLQPLTFDNFVIGNSNQTAYKMALAVAQNPGNKQGLNPLFIYGKSGLGKTHLLRAIQNYIESTRPELKVIYVDSSEFLNDYTDSAVERSKDKDSFINFRNKYESADVLLIDDIQSLQYKPGTLDAVFQIFNKFINQGKQMVLSADRSPKNIDIDERYWSRFASGGTFDIQPPEIETKLGIIKSYIDEFNQNEDNVHVIMPVDIQNYIAENSSSNIRELKGAVTIIICRLIDEKTITLSEAADILKEHFHGSGMKKLAISDIQSHVEGFFKIKHADMIGKTRDRNIAYPRQIAIYLCRELIKDASLEQIGEAFGRDHSTAIYSYRTIDKRLEENRETKEEIEALKHIILNDA